MSRIDGESQKQQRRTNFASQTRARSLSLALRCATECKELCNMTDFLQFEQDVQPTQTYLAFFTDPPDSFPPRFVPPDVLALSLLIFSNAT